VQIERNKGNRRPFTSGKNRQQENPEMEATELIFLERYFHKKNGRFQQRQNFNADSLW